jgi:hypothetical protein
VPLELQLVYEKAQEEVRLGQDLVLLVVELL